MRRELRTWVHTKKIRSRFANKNRKSCDETAMNTLRKTVMLALGVLTVLTFQANSAAQDGPAPGTAPGGPGGGAGPGGMGRGAMPGGPAGGGAPGRSGRGGGRGGTPDHPRSLSPFFPLGPQVARQRRLPPALAAARSNQQAEQQQHGVHRQLHSECFQHRVFSKPV